MGTNNVSAMRMGQKTTNEASNVPDRGGLSMNDFLQIMAAEISNQNPMGGDGGGSKTDYLSQMAQFATLEQLSSVTENISLITLMNQQQYSFSLIGKEVTVADEEGNVTGIVEKVKFQNGVAMLEVNGNYYYLGSVIEVGQKEVEE